jgi:hypothetical protein
MKQKQIYIRIELTAAAKAALAKTSDQAGMTELALMSRLTEWFVNEDELIQALVVGRYPSQLQTDIAKLLLRKMSSN